MEKMKFCQNCGNELIEKYLENEGDVPFCDKCNEYRFPMFNVAMSAIVFNPNGDRIALVQQYGKKKNILVAGYVSIGESVEDTLKREIMEELGLNVESWSFNASEYYEPSNTLMVNFACKVDSDDLNYTNDEIDYVKWYTVDEAKDCIVHGSLAEKFLFKWLDKNML